LDIQYSVLHCHNSVITLVVNILLQSLVITLLAQTQKNVEMIRKITTVLMLVCTVQLAQAQTWITDTLELGAGQTNDVYYNLTTGTKTPVSNTNWVLALSNQGGQKGAIYTNTNAGILCYNPHKPVSDWATISLTDTLAAVQQYNQDSCWYLGSFNASADGSAFDYGWGTYVGGPTHNVVGDSIFIIKQANYFFKVRIDSLGGYTKNWTITIGALGFPFPVADQTLTFAAGTKFANSNFIYATLKSAAPPAYFAIVDTVREPATADWDIVGAKYKKVFFIPQPFPRDVTGILGNGKVSAVRMSNIKLNDVLTTYNSAAYTKRINVIGADWKTFNQPLNKYDINDTTNSYVVIANNGAYYQIAFDSTSYAVATTKMIFKKRQIQAPTAIAEVNNLATAIGVYPNPTNADVTITAQSKQTVDAQLTVTNILGKTIITKNITVNQGLNAWSLPTQTLPAGHYILSIHGNQFKATSHFVKQ
jgi:hypothetical protein